MKRTKLSYPKRPKNTDKGCCNSNGDPDTDVFDMAVYAWKKDYKYMKSRMDKYKGNKLDAWALIYDQCLAELKNKLKGTQGYDTAKSAKKCGQTVDDDLWTCGYCCQFDLLSNEYMAIVAAIKNLFYFFQNADQSNADLHKDFMVMLEVIKEHGGTGLMTHFSNMLK